MFELPAFDETVFIGSRHPPVQQPTGRSGRSIVEGSGGGATANAPQQPDVTQQIFMPELDAKEFGTFNAEDVTMLTKATVEEVLAGEQYSPTMVNVWIQRIQQRLITKLIEQRKPLKYIVRVDLMQKAGAHLCCMSAGYYDSSTDGGVAIRWENKTMHCIITVFGMAV